MDIKWCPTCGEQLQIIEYPVNGVMTQFWYCSECGFEYPVIVPSSMAEQDLQSPTSEE